MSRRYGLLIGFAAIVAIAAGAIFLMTPPVSRVASPRAIAAPASEPRIRNGTKWGATAQVTASEKEWSSLPRGFDRNQQIEREAYELGIRDMSAAWRQLETIEDRSDRASFLRGLFTADARLAPREAVGWIKLLPDRAERSLAMQTLAMAWRGGVPANLEGRRGVSFSEEAALGISLIDGSVARAEMALAWADALVTQGPERAAILGAAAAGLTMKDPGRVLALAQSINDKHNGEIFRGAYADALRQMDSEAAWRQMQRLPRGDLRATAQNSILAAWASTDPTRAIGVLDEMPPGEEHTRAIAIIAEAWASQDTQAALTWAATMQGEQNDVAREAIGRVAPVGIGAVLDMANNGYPVIRELIPGGAAERSALIPAGSVITAITDATGATISTKGMELSEFVGKVRGREGTSVTVFIQAPGATTSQPVIIQRQQIIHKTAAK